MQKRFKYQAEIDTLLAAGCQLPTLFPPKGIHACRFTFAHETAKNHIPQYVANPRRMLRDVATNRSNTSLLALSCFSTQAKAQTFYTSLLKSFKHATITIGDSLAEGRLADADGMKTGTSTNGHFDFYEFEGCDLNASFTITKKLTENEENRGI